jgi:hypothetical protein
MIKLGHNAQVDCCCQKERKTNPLRGGHVTEALSILHGLYGGFLLEKP